MNAHRAFNAVYGPSCNRPVIPCIHQALPLRPFAVPFWLSRFGAQDQPAIIMRQMIELELSKAGDKIELSISLFRFTYHFFCLTFFKSLIQIK